MEIWLDTADLELIKQAEEMGILHGVTTNPSIVAKSKVGMEDLLEQILGFQKGPVTAQVTAQESAKMIAQGAALYQFSNRIIVKVPVTQEGLKAMHTLSKQKVPVMATAVFDTNQVLLAARAGASYIAPYFSSICELDMSGFDQFHTMIKLLKTYRYNTKVIAASLKSAEQVRQCLELGADAVTLNKEVFLSFAGDHEETLKRLDRFSKDWKGAKERRKLPL